MRFGIATVVLATFACASASPPDAVYLNVFDCYVAIPRGYVIHTRDRERSLHLYSRGGIMDPHGSILVGDFEALPKDRFRALSAQVREGLIIEEIELFSLDRAEPLIRIHDKTQQISLIGDATNHADAIISSCLGNKRES